MKKYILGILAVVLLISANDVFARPQGLEERGPLTRQTFIHYRRGFAKPGGVGGTKGATKCYGFIARGARWKSTEDYFVNATGSAMLDSEVLSTVNASSETWDTEVSFDVFGNGNLDSTATFSFNSTDNKNVLMFGDYDANVIGVTNVWGYFGGPTLTREIVEWDMLLNTDYTWGNADVDSTAMDLENIVTHELGHALGLNDQYELSCEPVTMFGYSANGEVSKRTLEQADIQGITELYK